MRIIDAHSHCWLGADPKDMALVRELVDEMDRFGVERNSSTTAMPKGSSSADDPGEWFLSACISGRGCSGARKAEMSQDLQQLKNEKAKLEGMLHELEAKREGQKKKLDELTVEKDKIYSVWSSTRDFQEASRIEMKFTAISRELSITQEGQKSTDMKIAGIKSSIVSLEKVIQDRERLQRSKWQVEKPGL